MIFILLVVFSDPFRPLWELHPAPKFIYSLDWLPDPRCHVILSWWRDSGAFVKDASFCDWTINYLHFRCILLSFDDGTMRLLSLTKAAYDGHVNGKPTVGPKQQGIHVFNSSSFAIWSVQVSRKTGASIWLHY